MTVKNTFTFYDDDEKVISNDELPHQETGLTKEQLLLKNLKSIAQEYLEVEQIKRKFVELIKRNSKKLDFFEFYEDQGFIIKENIIKKQISPANIRGLNVVSVDGSSVVKRFMNVDFSFLKAICVKYYFYKKIKISGSG